MSNFDRLSQHISEIDEMMENWMKKLNLNYNQFAVLHMLAVHSNGCTQKQIADEWYLPKQTVFNICKTYREQGWIVFDESQTDKRERQMKLTDLGKAHALPVKTNTDAMMSRAFIRFGTDNTEQLFRLMREFRQICQEEMEKE